LRARQSPGDGVRITGIHFDVFNLRAGLTDGSQRIANFSTGEQCSARAVDL
jgi:hypothetical protein